MISASDKPKRTGATLNRGGSNQIVGTPWEFIRACERRWGTIMFDLAASHDNAKAPRYFTKAQNSLLQSWAPLTGNLFLNCEYAQLPAFTYKCRQEYLAKDRQWRRIIGLFPAAVGSNWYAENCFPYAASVFLNGRVTFVGEKDPYPKDLMAIVWGEWAKCEIWRWNQRSLSVPKL